MKPEPALVRGQKGGQIAHQRVHETIMRRSDIAAISATAMPSESRLSPSAAPTAFAPESARGSSGVPTTHRIVRHRR